MKNLLKITALCAFAAASMFFGTSCESDAVVKRETTTTSTPGYFGGTSSSTTTTIVGEVDD